MFFDMSKIKISCPVSKRNGVNNGFNAHYQVDTKLSLTAMDVHRNGS
jgi:hypothetical protein